MPVGTYAYTPAQLERINARRERRGQEPLIQRGSKYAEEYSKRQASEKPKRRFPETDEEETRVTRLGEVETPRLAEGLKKTKAFEDRLREEFLNRNYQKSLMRS